MTKPHAVGARIKPSGGVNGFDLRQKSYEEFAEFPDPSVALAELLMQRRPRHELATSLGGNAVKALREPAIDV